MKRRMMMGKSYEGLDPDTAPYGVYVEHVNGKLFTVDMWNPAWNDQANGVAVISEECRFSIAPDDNSSLVYWGTSSSLVSGVTTTTSEAEALMDYNGVQNTDAWVAFYSVNTSYAAGWCRNYTFKNGKKGHLGSCGEWDIACKNKSMVDACMAMIGGSEISNTSNYWTSTQATRMSAWVFSWKDNLPKNVFKAQSVQSSRAFCSL